MDTVIIVLVGTVVLVILVILAARYGQGRIRPRSRHPEDVARRDAVADAARPGEGDPGKSARSAAVGTGAPRGPSTPPRK